MENEHLSFEEFLGKDAYKRFQIDLAILLGITMVEENLDRKEAAEFLLTKIFNRVKRS